MREVLILLSAIVAFMLACALLYKHWEEYYERKNEREKNKSFDFDKYNEENFGI